VSCHDLKYLAPENGHSLELRRPASPIRGARERGTALLAAAGPDRGS
jgi:hypothetical protein